MKKKHVTLFSFSLLTISVLAYTNTIENNTINSNSYYADTIEKLPMHEITVSLDDISDETSENDYIEDIEYPLEQENYSLKQRVINFGKNLGIRVLLFMLDTRDYFNNGYEAVENYFWKKSEEKESEQTTK